MDCVGKARKAQNWTYTLSSRMGGGGIVEIRYGGPALELYYKILGLFTNKMDLDMAGLCRSMDHIVSR